MTNAMETKWVTLQEQYRAAVAAKWALDSDLQQKYGFGGCWWVYCNRGETKKREAISARMNKISDRMWVLIDQAVPTTGYKLRSGIPAHTIYTKMTWDEVLVA